MKPYILFKGSDFYPNGGFGDYVACFETEQNAKTATAEDGDWASVCYFDGEQLREVDRLVNLIDGHGETRQVWESERVKEGGRATI